MNSPLQQLIESRLPFAGVAAWAARMPDHAAGQESFVDWFSPDQLAQLLALMIQAAENLPRHHFEPQGLCWVFEHARVHLAARPDGAYLALFVENRPEVQAAAIQDLLASFRALPEL